MINLARLGAFLLLSLVTVVPAYCQDEPVKPVGERLDEVRATMDEAYANIATLQQHLNNATDAKDESRIEKLREEIDYVWTEIERLKSLEEMLLDLKDKDTAKNDGRPRRAFGGDGGRREFNNDTSSGGTPPRGNGFVMEDGTTGDPFRHDTSTGERPRRAMPGGEKENELGPPPRRPRSQERPVRAGGPVRSPAAGQPDAPLTSRKLSQLQASYDALIEAGEAKLAERVLKSIETEKQRLLKEAKEQAERDARNNRGRQGEQQPGRNGGGGGLASTEPSAGSGGKSQEDLIRELENLIRQLQEENKELRDKNDNDQ